MRSVRFTKREAEALLREVSQLDTMDDNMDVDDDVKSAVTKIRAAMEPVPAGLNVRPIEAALIAHSRGRVVPLLGAPGHRWARLSKEGTELGVDVPKAEVLGAWLARQGWMTSTLTIADVFRRWPEWYSKAEAERAPNVGQSTDGQRRPTAAGRRPPGLG